MALFLFIAPPLARLSGTHPVISPLPLLLLRVVVVVVSLTTLSVAVPTRTRNSLWRGGTRLACDVDGAVHSILVDRLTLPAGVLFNWTLGRASTAQSYAAPLTPPAFHKQQTETIKPFQHAAHIAISSYLAGREIPQMAAADAEN